MTEYEWEVSRVPKRRNEGIIGHHRPQPSSVGEYVSLEFPRETSAWVLGNGVETASVTRASRKTKVREPLSTVVEY